MLQKNSKKIERTIYYKFNSKEGPQTFYAQFIKKKSSTLPYNARNKLNGDLDTGDIEMKWQAICA